jgi:hypothetical protein
MRATTRSMPRRSRRADFGFVRSVESFLQAPGDEDAGRRGAFFTVASE